MASDTEICERIRTAAEDLFCRFGFTRVTVDEIATSIGISKKTLYKHYQSKDILLRKVTRGHLREVESQIKIICGDGKIDFVIRLKSMFSFISSLYGKLSRPLIKDLQKNAPDVWKEIDAFRRESIFTNFGMMVSEGQAKGAFRKDVNGDILVLIYSAAVQNVLNPEVLAQLPHTAVEAFDNVVKVMLEGVLTDKARLRYHADKRN